MVQTWFAPEAKISWVSLKCLPFFNLRLTEATTAFFVQIHVIGIDSISYGKLVIVPWNIVRYKISGGSERDPNVYGPSSTSMTSTSTLIAFYLWRLSPPALGVTYIFDRKRLRIVTSTSNQSSPFVLSLRLAPHCIYGFAFSVYDHIKKNVSNSTARRL